MEFLESAVGYTVDPALRLTQPLEACPEVHDPLLLVSYSMGDWVAAEATMRLDARGIFLVAPALGMPGYPSQALQMPTQTEIVDTWGHEIIPCEHAIRFPQTSV